MTITDSIDRIPNGTLVRLYDGSEATAYYDPRDGTYRTAQPSGHGGTRVDEGWRREQLTPVAPTTSPSGGCAPLGCNRPCPRCAQRVRGEAEDRAFDRRQERNTQ